MRHLRILGDYCKKLKIKIKHNEEDFWAPDVKTIFINFNAPKKRIVSVLLHELGHALDHSIITKKQLETTKDAYYSLFYRGVRKEHMCHIVLESEVRAWCYGEEIAKVLDLKLGAWFNKEKKSALKAYGKYLKVRSNK